MKEMHSAWNPGLGSEIPRAYRKLETIHRPENVSSSMRDIEEISALTGLKEKDLVVFRPDRLALHELIVRITADIVVLEGRDEIELGRNFRLIARTMLNRHIEPTMPGLRQEFERLRTRVYSYVSQAISETLFNAPNPVLQKRRFFPIQLGHKKKLASPDSESILEREHKALSAFKEKGLAARDPLSSVIYKNIYLVLGSIAGNRGYLGPDREFLINLVCNRVCNTYGSEHIGGLIAPLIEKAVKMEGYSRITNAHTPLLVSLKGASAAGKSSLRPMLKQLMQEHGIKPGGYATISPDIWRRLLLDYGALGDAYKYAGRLTSQEVVVIDGKLDRYIQDKADRLGAMPHLLVDRFRFDSFSTERITRILHATYLKHVHTLTMYFLVTPPHAAVERGWERGLMTGRYKAVEDFLDHSVEAYIGMPKILFKWLAYDRPLFRYDILDNSVPKGTYPNRVAFGTQKEMNILDCSVFIDIERYQKINIRARSPEEVYPSESMLSVENNIGFLKQCIGRIPRVNFLDQVTGVSYLKVRNGVFSIVDRLIFDEKLKDAERFGILTALAPHLVNLSNATAAPCQPDSG